MTFISNNISGKCGHNCAPVAVVNIPLKSPLFEESVNWCSIFSSCLLAVSNLLCRHIWKFPASRSPFTGRAYVMTQIYVPWAKNKRRSNGSEARISIHIQGKTDIPRRSHRVSSPGPFQHLYSIHNCQQIEIGR